MSEMIHGFDALVRFTKWEDPEVRYWAIDRLIRHFPEDCCDAIAPFVMDDHDATPAMVARHLGEHGGPKHHAILLRGFKVLRGMTPGFCLQALARLGYPGIGDLASAALQRGDLNEPALAMIVETLADMGQVTGAAIVREFINKKVELLAEPAALRGALKVAEARSVTRSGLLIGEIDGVPAREHPLAPALTEAGFVHGAFGFQWRVPRTPAAPAPEPDDDEDEPGD